MCNWLPYYGRYLVIAISLLVFVHSWPVHADDDRAAEPTVLAEFSVAKGGETILLPVETLGRRTQFVLDTGCSENFYDAKFSKGLRKIQSVKVRTPGGMTSLDLFEGPSATFGTLKLEHGRGICAGDLSRMREVDGVEFDGLIGIPSLRRYVVEIDFDEGRTRFLSAISRDCGHVFEMSLEKGVPTITAALLANDSEMFRIDTGNSGELDINGGSFDLLRLEKKLKERTSGKMATIGGDVVDRRGRLSEFRLGEFTHRDLQVSRSATGNWIGTKYLSRFRVTFDFPNGKLYLKPGKAYNRASVADAFGAGVVLRNGQYVVDAIYATSAAEKVGIQVGDQLLEVNDRPTSEFRLFDLRKFLSRAGETVKLKVQHGDEVRTVNVMLREY